MLRRPLDKRERETGDMWYYFYVVNYHCSEVDIQYCFINSYIPSSLPQVVNMNQCVRCTSWLRISLIPVFFRCNKVCVRFLCMFRSHTSACGTSISRTSRDGLTWRSRWKSSWTSMGWSPPFTLESCFTYPASPNCNRRSQGDVPSVIRGVLPKHLISLVTIYLQE